MKNIALFIVFGALLISIPAASQKSLKDYGIKIGVMKQGANNAITDVPGVRVGHCTLIEGENIRTGVTAIIPHEGNLLKTRYQLQYL
jgi:L-aminopeptidase DmpA. Serine peptidase. MEROPS family S58